MSIHTSPHLTPIQCYTTSPYPCSYLERLEARSQVAVLDTSTTCDSYNELIQLGFRRSGLFVYKPSCEHCSACIPVRVAVDEFTPNRQQRRSWKLIDTVDIQISPLVFDEDTFALYQRYKDARHYEFDPDTTQTSERDTFSQFLLKSHVNSQLVKFFNKTGQLIAASVIDIVSDGVSAVYTFFAPDFKGSLGTFAVLWQIKYAKQLNLPYVYLGYWIAQSRKMSYKSNFQPIQVYQNQHWQTLVAST